MPAMIPGTALHSFGDAFRKATQDVFLQAFGANWAVEIDTSDPAPTSATSLLSFQVAASGGLEGNAILQVESENALLLAQKFLAEQTDPSAELNKDRKDALEELLRQIAGLAAITLTGLFHETMLELNRVEPGDWQGVEITLLASDGPSAKVALKLRLSSELLASISSTAVATAVVTPVANSEASNAAATRESNFDLLLGVHLSLTLRFGQRILPLREILDLASGSVIELDHEVQDPADLLLGDKVIARGQVVIVDGNYGIRITEVTDARQRIGTL
jgi:flagellar motor switch protein FliN